MKNLISPVKGTRDFYPDEMARRAWLLAKIRKVSQSYGYQEYEGPFLERFELYAAKSGEELVMKQSYVFEDRGGDRLTLRPELTPTLARMVAQKQKELAIPARWWMFGPFWRYEQPQKGRTREFFQWNIDLLGAVTPESDAELVAIAATFLKEVGLSPAVARIGLNDRKLMNEQLTKLGVSNANRKAVFSVIDRRDKLSPAAWRDYAIGSGLTAEQVDGIQAMQENKDLWRTSDSLSRILDLLERVGLKEYVEFDPEVIRGLDYYTGIVFEARPVGGGRAILGGGHYDNLISDVGGDLLPAVGFAMGDVMISTMLEDLGIFDAVPSTPAEALVTVFDADSTPDAFALAAELRSAGINTILYPEPAKLQKQLKYADRIGVRTVIIAGPDERANDQVTIKDLSSRSQETVARAALPERLRQMLA